MNAQRREALLKEYGEVSNLFRTLTDIRFRLLGILPIATAATAALAAHTQADGEFGVPVALALFGLVAAIGVVTYNARNDQLYNELVGRAAAIERSVGLPDGAFACEACCSTSHDVVPPQLATVARHSAQTFRRGGAVAGCEPSMPTRRRTGTDRPCRHPSTPRIPEPCPPRSCVPSG